MAELTDLLKANQSFYDAFNERNVAKMEKLWSEKAPVACIHPGWAPMFERSQILDSWTKILRNPKAPIVLCRQPQASVYGVGGFVICYEQVGQVYLVATNVYTLEDGQWRMVHHHAGPTPGGPGTAAEPPIQLQ